MLEKKFRENHVSRRSFCQSAALAAAGVVAGGGGRIGWAEEGAEWTALFDGKTLDGWHLPEQRVGHGTGGKWQVEEGTITGTQDPPGNGGLLFSDETFGDFELELEIKPDWGIDSGLFVRSTPRGQAFQVTVDYYHGGYIGEIYGEGLGGFNTRTLGILGTVDEQTGELTALEATPRGLPEGTNLDYGITADKWLAAWQLGEWNALRVRVVGQLPRITTWLNGVMVVDFNAATYHHPRFDAEEVAKIAPREGHIALQIHGGTQRWREGAKCRWRNIRVKRRRAGGG